MTGSHLNIMGTSFCGDLYQFCNCVGPGYIVVFEYQIVMTWVIMHVSSLVII